MTQYYSYKKFSLLTAPLHVRVLITAFNVVILVALCVGLVNYWDKTGMTPAGVMSFYRGNESQTLAAGQAMTFEKTFRELLDATHPHLFGQGVLLFILSHIVALTRLGQRAKITIYLVSFGAMLLDAAVPWLIRYVAPELAPVQIVSVSLLTGAFVAQMLFPVREMWFMGGAPVDTAATDATTERPPARAPRPERRPRRDRRDSHHRTGPAPRAEPRGERTGRGERGERPKPAESGGEAGSSPQRRNRRRRGRRPQGQGGGEGRNAEGGGSNNASPSVSPAPVSSQE